MSNSWGLARIAQSLANVKKLNDRYDQRSTLVVDADGMELLKAIERVQVNSDSVEVSRAIRVSFLAEGQEALLGQLSSFESAEVAEMPNGCMVYVLEGSDHDSWVLRVEHNASSEYIDVAFRAVDSGDYLLYLVSRHMSR